MRTVLIAIATAIALAGCGTAVSEAPAGPPNWKQGYADGCNSGYVSAGHPYYRYTKDVNRALNDKEYAMGWQDGFNRCQGSYAGTQRMMR